MMDGIRFLSVDDLLLIHSIALETGGGASEVLDLGRLEAAAGAPQASWGGCLLNETLEDMAAALLVSLCLGHPFADGNKRTAALAAVTFLADNGRPSRLTPEHLANLVLDVATGVIGKTEVARAFALP